MPEIGFDLYSTSYRVVPTRREEQEELDRAEEMQQLAQLRMGIRETESIDLLAMFAEFSRVRDRKLVAMAVFGSVMLDVKTVRQREQAESQFRMRQAYGRLSSSRPLMVFWDEVSTVDLSVIQLTEWCAPPIYKLDPPAELSAKEKAKAHWMGLNKKKPQRR